MTPFVRRALGGAAVVAAVAGALVLVGLSDEPNIEPQAAVSSVAESTGAPPSASPTPAPSAARTATAIPTTAGPAPLSVDIARTAAPAAGGDYAAAEVPVELSSVCEGASFDLVASTPIYASLQTTEPSLRYIDAALVVYDSPVVAARAYEDLAAAVATCPLTRTVTPTPAPSATQAAPIQVTGKHADVSIGALPAIQWIQLQTVDSPDTQLRTAVTVTVVKNVLLAISVDQDSETASADAVATASIGHANAVVDKLLAAAAP